MRKYVIIKKRSVKDMSADLHCHSKCSDGATSVQNVIRLAKFTGLNAIALTDHDTFKGVEEAQFYGKKYGIEVIHGAEISAYDFERKRQVHILCYNCRKPEVLFDIFEESKKNRYEAMQNAMKKISEVYAISMEMVEENARESSTVFKSHIMYTLMEAGYTERVYGDLYRKIFDWKTGFAKTQIAYPDVYEVIDLIHQAQGIAILAHPTVYDTMPAIDKMIAKGIDGIECWYPRGTQKVTDELLAITEKHHLLRTGGTDFHGYSAGKVNPIGTCTTPDDDLRRLINWA